MNENENNENVNDETTSKLDIGENILNLIKKRD